MPWTPWKPLAVAADGGGRDGPGAGARRAGARPAGLQRREVRRSDRRREGRAERAGAGERRRRRPRPRASRTLSGNRPIPPTSTTRGRRSGSSVPDQLTPRDHVDYLVGLGVSLYLDGCIDGCFSAAAETVRSRAGARRGWRRSRARVRMVGRCARSPGAVSGRTPSVASIYRRILDARRCGTGAERSVGVRVLLAGGGRARHRRPRARLGRGDRGLGARARLRRARRRAARGSRSAASRRCCCPNARASAPPTPTRVPSSRCCWSSGKKSRRNTLEKVRGQRSKALPTSEVPSSDLATLTSDL